MSRNVAGQQVWNPWGGVVLQHDTALHRSYQASAPGLIRNRRWDAYPGDLESWLTMLRQWRCSPQPHGDHESDGDQRPGELDDP